MITITTLYYALRNSTAIIIKKCDSKICLISAVNPVIFPIFKACSKIVDCCVSISQRVIRWLNPDSFKSHLPSVYPIINKKHPSLISLPEDVLRIIIRQLKKSHDELPSAYVSRTFRRLVNEGDKATPKAAVEQAIRLGSINLFKWYLNKCQYRWPRNSCMIAAKAGHLKFLQWARAQGCPWDEKTCASAASSGHLELIQWAQAQGCPCNIRTCAEAALRNDHVEILKWALVQGCPSFSLSPDVQNNAGRWYKKNRGYWLLFGTLPK